MSEGILPGIDHIVVVILENRSFDTMLGWLYEDDEPDHFLPKGACFRYEGLREADLPKYAQPLTVDGLPPMEFPPVRGARFESGGVYLDSPPVDPHEELQNVTNQIYGPFSKPMINPPPGASPNMKGFLQDYSWNWSSSSRKDNLEKIKKILETYTRDQLPVLSGLAKAFAAIYVSIKIELQSIWIGAARKPGRPLPHHPACWSTPGG